MEQDPCKCGLKKKLFYAFTTLGHGFDPTRLPVTFALRFPVVSASSMEAPAVTPGAEAAGPGPESTGFFTNLFKSHDQVKRTIIDQSMFAPIPGETGWDRMKAMYSMDQFGNLGPEWQHIIQGLYVGLIGGIAIGFFVGGRNAAERFVRQNEGTKFLSQMAARRALQDKMTLSMGSHSLKWGWRLAVFTGLYLFTASNFAVYRGRSSVVDYVAGGAVTGALWKFVQGPRAMLVAGALGSILGLGAGSLSLIVLRASGMSMEEMRYWHYQAKLMRQGEVIGKMMPPSEAPEEENAPSQSAEPDRGASIQPDIVKSGNA